MVALKVVIHALETIHEEDHEDSLEDVHSEAQVAIHEEDHEDSQAAIFWRFTRWTRPRWSFKQIL